MQPSAYLALDLGAESGRAILGVLRDNRLELHPLHRFPSTPLQLPDGLHWDIAALYRECLEGIRRAADYCRSHNLELRSVGVDAWGVDFGLIGRSGELLTLPRCYRDPRFTAAFEKTVAAIGPEVLYLATGIQLMPINTLYQLVALRETEPDVLRAAHRLLFMPDLLHYLLTGRATTERTIASTSQMIDWRTGDWAAALLDLANVPTQMLGPIIDPATLIGPLLPHVAAETGASASVRVIAPATHDTAAAIAAVPAAPDSRWCYLSSGTWSLFGAELPVRVLALNSPFTNEVGLDRATLFLKNITGLWLLQELRRDLAARGADHDYADLTRLAATAPPFRTLINPDDSAFASAGRIIDKIATFAQRTRQPIPVDPGTLARCILESFALCYRRTLAQLEELLMAPARKPVGQASLPARGFDVLHIVGGGSRNDLLNQMTADATARTVLAGPAEATAAGNILTQALGDGRLADRHAIRSIVAASFPPQVITPREPSAWDAPYARFCELCS